MLRWRLACALGSSTWSTLLRYLALTRSTLTLVQSGKGHHGRRVRIFRSVATTKHPSQPSTSSVAKSVLTRSIRARGLDWPSERAITHGACQADISSDLRNRGPE